MEKLADFKTRITGDVILPDNAAYDDLRNAFYQPGSPAVVVQVRTRDDIAASIQYARDNQLKLAVRSGGHSPAGLSTNDGGLVIDLSHFNTVEVLDSASGRVRIGAGGRWGDVAQALGAHGLAVSSGDTNSVGVGGLTLGGGIGWMVRKYGLAIDSLDAAEIVTADGRTLRVSADSHPDLFWALRGGGGNFGVVTSFDFCAQPITSVFGGMVSYDITSMETVLKNWTTAMRAAPEELNSTLVVFPGFGPEFPAQVMIYLCYGEDDEAAAHEAIAPLLQLGGTIQQQDIQKKLYYEMLEEAPVPAGIKPLTVNGFVKSLNDDVLGAITDNYGQPGQPIVQIRSLGGAMARVHSDATAFAHRDYEAFVLTGAFAPVDVSPEESRRIQQESWKPMQPFASGGYINFLTDTSEISITRAYPPATYTRLASIKAEYDPNNIFNQNHNIKPGVRQPVTS